VSGSGAERRALLARARLYLVCDTSPGGRALAPFLSDCLGGGVGAVQLRDKQASDQQLLDAGAIVRRACSEHGALFLINDRADLVTALDADGVHLGQDDTPAAAARELLGGEQLIGLSTHTAAQVDGARDVDYIGVGPVHATPTKPGREAVGVELIRHAAAHASGPFFAIGGLDEANVGAVVEAGAQRIAVVRALTEADDPGEAARRLRAALLAPATSLEAGVGAA
jgi:thiamine-phosphate pyrophosphorylase